MANYNINKGIGRSPEFNGLVSQYIFVFAGGLISIFIVFVILYTAGVSLWICLAFGLIAGSLLVWGTFSLNRKYGENGLMKLMAMYNHPRYLINRKRIQSLLKKPEA